MKISNTLKNMLFYSAIILSVSPMIACSVTSHKETAGQYVDDAVITASIKTSILKDSELKTYEIHVETLQGVVQLSGFVKSKNHFEKAELIAKSTKNVKKVINNIIVRD